MHNSEWYNVTDLSQWWTISDKLELPQLKYIINKLILQSS